MSPPFEKMDRRVMFAAASLVAVAGWAQAEFPVDLEVLHTTSSTLPGMPSATLSSLQIPAVNHRGDIIFTATALNSGAPIRSNNTLLLNRDGVLSVVLQGGVPAPGTGLTFGDFSVPPVMNESGGIVVRSQLLTGNTVAGHGVFRIVNGTPEMIAHSAMDAPDTEPDTRFPSFVSNYTDLGIARNGDVVFRSNLEGPSITNLNDTALWSFADAILSPIAREGGPAPVAPGVNFAGNPANLYFQPVAFSARGRAAFTAGVTGHGVTSGNDTALFLGGIGGVQAILREGDPALAAGLPPNAVHGPLASPHKIAINDSGELLFASFLTGTGINTTNDLSVWKQLLGVSQLVLRENDPIPGTPDGVLLNGIDFSQLGRSAAMNSRGAFLLTVSLKGPSVTPSNDFAIYGDIGGNKGLLIREGDPVPGLPGQTFASSSTTTTFMINRQGDVFIRTPVAGPGVTIANDETLWFWTVEHGLQLIFREGGSAHFTSGPLPVGSTSLPAYSAGDDEATGTIFNNRGELVLNTVVNGSAAIIRATLRHPPTIEWHPVGFFGGQPRATSANYVIDSSMDPVAGSSAAAAAYVARSGFAGQLVDAIGLDASPLVETAENTQFQIEAALEMDDGTVTRLPPGAARWFVKSGPITAVTDSGLAKTGLVFEDTKAQLELAYLNFTETRIITVLDTIPDNFGDYGGDALPDDWQIANFGMPPNDQAAPTADPDGNGQNNLMEYLAGTDPNDPKSRFIVVPTATQAAGTFSLRIGTVIPGTKYTVLRNPGIAAAGWIPLREITVNTRQDGYVVTDASPFPDKGFYRIVLEPE